MLMNVLKIFNTVILIVVVLCLCSCDHKHEHISTLGMPTRKYYANNLIARCIWDMEIINNKLYIGCGDYNGNSGPTPLLFYDLNEKTWNNEKWFDEEQIGRILNIDGKFVIPGFDPIGLPEFSSFYLKEQDKWKCFSVIANGEHTYDLIKFNDKWFCGIGAKRGSTSIISLDNNFINYTVPMIKDGKEINTNGGECIRTHNFYILNNTLFADFWFENISENKLISEIYKYENEKFVFHSTLIGKLNTALYCRNLPPIYCKAKLNNTIFITTGFLYYTKDLKKFTKINFDDYARTYDIYEFNGRFYFLTGVQNKNNYKIVIYSTISEKINDFKVEKTFNWPLHPTAFAVNKNNFYIAVGEWNAGNEDNGTILNIPRR